MAKKKVKKKLIDILHKSLIDAGYVVERDGWKENQHSNPPNDKCEWLDVILNSRENKKEVFTVHFYFTHNSTQLEELSVFKSKIVYDDDKLLTNKL